jgi:glucose-1-phosphate adenylyltransferase
MRHLTRHDADYYLILAGDHLYRMDYSAMVDAHIERHADITIAAQPVTSDDATSMGIFRFDRNGQIIAFEEKPSSSRLGEIERSIPTGALMTGYTADKPFVASMGVYVFSRDVLVDLLRTDPATDFGREVIPSSLGRFRVNAYVFLGYWADVGTVASFYDANMMLTRAGAPFSFYDPHRPIYTHPRFLPGSRVSDCTLRDVIVSEGSYLDKCDIQSSIVGIRSSIHAGARIRDSVLLGADYYESDNDAPARGDRPRLGIGPNVELSRVIVDKNARIGEGVSLTNKAGLDHADGDGYFIRNGIVIVPKDGVVPAGTVV